MLSDQAATRRRVQCVRILSNYPLLVQDKLAKVTRSKKHKTTKVLAAGIVVIIRESKSGELLIEFRPP
jgi:hypothetical protein